jgi:hypothetical protein
LGDKEVRKLEMTLQTAQAFIVAEIQKPRKR